MTTETRLREIEEEAANSLDKDIKHLVHEYVELIKKSIYNSKINSYGHTENHNEVQGR